MWHLSHITSPERGKNGVHTIKEGVNEVTHLIAHNARPTSNQRALSEQRATGSHTRGCLTFILPLYLAGPGHHWLAGQREILVWVIFLARTRRLARSMMLTSTGQKPP
jgi:hypothetical protein